MDVMESYSNATVLRANFRRHRNRLCLGTALTLASLAAAGPAFAASPADGCTPTNTPANGQTVTCTGAVVLGVIAENSTGVTVNVVPDATVIPPSGPAIWLGADAELNLAVRSVTGNEAIDSYAVLLGNGATVTLDGTIRGRGGITGPTQVSGSTGLAGAFITLNAGSQIVTNGSALNAAIDGRAGGNRYLVQGAIRATGTSGQGIRPGNGDIITLDTAGSITTLSGDTSNPIDGSGKTGVTVLTGVGSLIELHGIGRGMQLGANADVTVAGTIRSYGDAAITNSSGGAGIDVGANSTVRLLASGQIVTGNTGGLGNGGNGGTGITSFVSGNPSNTDVIVDGVIDTQRGQGIFGGIGDTLTVGATGRITTRGTGRSLFYNTQTSVGNGTLAIDIAGNVEQLGSASALFISASRAQGETVETPVTANVTIREGGRLHSAANVAYAQDDGAGNFPEVIDNLVVAGTISRGGVGVAIGLNDGADRVTFMPTYALIGDVDGGTDAAQATEIDTFALDGGQGTSATFNFASTQMRNFEAGEKLGAGTWTLTGDSSGLNGIFAVKQGLLTVGGVMTSTGVDVASGATLSGSGAFTGAGKIANGGILLGSAGSDLGFGSLVLNPTSLVNVTLGAPSTAALFNVTGGLTLDGLLNVTNGGGFALGTYRLFDYAGALTNNGLTIQSLPQGFNPGDWEIGTGTTGQVNLIVAAGPGEQYWDGGNLTPGNIANGRGGTASWNTTSTNWTNQAGSINAPWAGGIAVFAPCPSDGCTSGYTVTVDAAGVSAKGLRTLNAGVKLTGGTITLADDSRIDVTQPVLSGSGTLSAGNAIHVTGDLIKGGIGSFLSTGQTLIDGGLTVEQGVMSASGAAGVVNVAGTVSVGGAGTDTFPTRLVATAGAKLTSAGGSVGGAANTAGSIYIQFGGTWDAGANAIDVGASGTGVLRVYSNFINEVSEIKASEIVLGRNAGGNGLLQIWGDDVDAILTTATIRGGVGGGSVEFDNQSSTTASVFTPLLSGNLSTTFLSGVTTLKGVNNYTGATLVNGGKLFLDGASLPGTAVTVQRGTLGGAGTIAGPVSFAATNTILQGSVGQLLNMGSLALGSGTAVNVTLGAPSTAALFNVTGGLTLDGLLNVTNGGGFALGSYRLFDYAGALTNNGLTIQTLPQGFNPGDWAIDTGTTGQVSLIVAAGPGEQYWDGTNLTPGNIANGRGGTATWNATSTNWTNQAGSINARWASGIAVFGPCPANACAFGSGTSPSYTVTVDAAGVSAKGLRTLDVPVTLAGGKITLADDARIDVNQPISSGSGTLNASNVIQATGDLIKGGLGSFFFTGQTLVDGGLNVEQGVMMATEASAALNVTGAITVGSAGIDAFPTRLLATGGAKITSAGGSVGGAASTAGSIIIQRGGSWDAGANAIDVGASGVGVLRVYSSLITAISEIKASEIVLGRNAGGNGKLQIWGDAGSGIVTAATVRGGIGGGNVEFDNRNSTTYAFAPLLTGNLSATFLSGVTSLHGINDYTGATLVNGGKLFLDGANLTNSAVTVQHGTLGGRGTIAGAVDFAAANTILQGSAGQALNMGSLALGSGTAINVTLGAPSTSALFDITGALTLDGLLNVTDGGGFTYGAYRLFDHGGALTDNGLTIQSLPAGFNPGDWTIDTATARRVTLNVVQGNGDQYWDGTNMAPGGVANGRGGSGIWNAANTNWTNQANTINAPWAGQKAVFAAAGASTVTIAGTQTATGLRFLSGANYSLIAGAGGGLTLSGMAQVALEQQGSDTTTAKIAAPIGGSGGLMKSGAGTLILTGADSYAGGTTIDSGTLRIGDGGTTGSVTGDIVNQGMLVFDRSDAFGFGGAITGAGSLVKAGAGTMTLTGAATQGGGTTVSAGMLRVGAGGSLDGNAIVSTGATLAFDRTDAVTHGGTIGGAGAILKQGAGTLTLTGNSGGFAGSTSVQAGTLDLSGTLGGALSIVSGATLTGAGTASSAVSIGAGGTLSGRSGTTLAMGSLTLVEGAVVDAALGAPGGNGLFAVAGNLVLDGTLNVTDAGGYGLGVYRLFDYGGALTDNGLGIGQRPQADGTVTTVQTGQTGQVNLVVEVKTGPDFVQFWNGSTTSPTGRVVGGSGTWTAEPLTNWTNPNGSASYGWNGGFAVFQGTAGTVTTEAGVSTQGMQFAVDGYRLAGAAVTLAAPGMTIVRVGDGSAAGAAWRATIDAALTGASGLEKQDLGTLILTGVNSYTGGTHIAAGTLGIGNGGTTGSVTGNIANDGALVFNRSNAYDFTGAISGAGTLTKLGAGTLRLGGTHGYTGATLVSAGTLTVDGSIDGSAVTVSAGATLAGIGTVGTTTVAGTIAPGNSPGTLTIAGNYTQLAGSTYAYEPGDLIRVTGTAVIQGGRVSAANAAGVSYRLGDRSAILTAAGGRSGPGFARVDLANPLAQPFLTLGLAYDATSVYLQAVRNAVTFESIGGTINQRAAARGVDGLAATSPLYVSMASIGSAAAARAGFDTLSGEIHATVKGVLLDESRHLREAVANRLDQAGAEGNGIWGQAIGAWGDADSDGNAAALDRSTAGLLLGVDTALGGQWRAGLTGGYTRAKLDVDARASSATVDTVQVGAFAGGRWGGTSLQFGAALAWHNIATRRASGFTGYADTTRGAYDARGLQLFARAGHAFDLGKATLEPFGTIAHARLKTDAFAEQGGTSALSAAKRTDSATWTTLGLRGSVPVSTGASLYGSAAWRHALDGHLPSADLAFGSGTPFRVYGTPLDRDAAALDLGARFGIGASGSFAIGYAGTIGSATSDHGVRASVAFRF